MDTADEAVCLLREAEEELARATRECAPWHGLATYGRREGNRWRSPSALCTKEVSLRLLDHAKFCVMKISAFIKGQFSQ